MKVVIIKEIEKMPTDCDSCPFQDYDRNCGILGEYTMLNEWAEDAPYYDLKGKGDCPLRPLPRRMSMRDEAEFYLGYMNGKTKYLGFNEGYNACLEDILGGE